MGTRWSSLKQIASLLKAAPRSLKTGKSFGHATLRMLLFTLIWFGFLNLPTTLEAACNVRSMRQNGNSQRTSKVLALLPQ